MASKYCLNCGYANDAQRGACLMCHAPLPAAPAYAEQVPEAIAAMQPPPGPEAIAALLIDATGDSFGGIGGGAAEADYGHEPAEDYEMETLGGFEAVESGEEAAPAELDGPEEELAEAPPELPDEGPEEVDEEFVPPPPPPGAVELEEEPVAPEPDLAAAVEEAVPEYHEAEQEEPSEEPAGDDWTIGKE